MYQYFNLISILIILSPSSSHTSQKSPVDPNNSSILVINQQPQIPQLSTVVPKFGVGSKSCAGRENRTDAMSATPTNLKVPVSAIHAHGSYIVCAVMVRRTCEE